MIQYLDETMADRTHRQNMDIIEDALAQDKADKIRNVDFFGYRSQVEEFVSKRLKYKYQNQVGVQFQKLMGAPETCYIHEMQNQRKSEIMQGSPNRKKITTKCAHPTCN